MLEISHPALLVFLLGVEKPACSLEKDEETNVLLIALCEVIDRVLSKVDPASIWSC